MENNTYIYSAKENAFFIKTSAALFGGKWPDDAVDVANSVFDAFAVTPREGKQRLPDGNGLPSWHDIPPEVIDYAALADAEKDQRIASAKETISLWQSELLLGDISDEDRTALKAWVAYIKAVQQVDITAAPDIAWPEIPA